MTHIFILATIPHNTLPSVLRHVLTPLLVHIYIDPSHCSQIVSLRSASRSAIVTLLTLEISARRRCASLPEIHSHHLAEKQWTSQYHVSLELFEVQKRQTTFLTAWNKITALIHMSCWWHEEKLLKFTLLEWKAVPNGQDMVLKLPFCRLIIVQPNCIMVWCSPKQLCCSCYIISSWTLLPEIFS